MRINATGTLYDPLFPIAGEGEDIRLTDDVGNAASSLTLLANLMPFCGGQMERRVRPPDRY
jgi:hypothetical protein